MKIEGPERDRLPYWQVMALMASLSVATGLSATLYLSQLLGCVAIDGVQQGVN